MRGRGVFQGDVAPLARTNTKAHPAVTRRPGLPGVYGSAPRKNVGQDTIAPLGLAEQRGRVPAEAVAEGA
jgi:hypothetical protein